MGNRKPQVPRNADDPEQSRRFIETALGADAEEPAADADHILVKLAGQERPIKARPSLSPRTRGRPPEV